jgi:hypothetical protein
MNQSFPEIQPKSQVLPNPQKFPDGGNITHTLRASI